MLSTVDIWGNARKSLLFTGATYVKLSSKKKKNAGCQFWNCWYLLKFWLCYIIKNYFPIKSFASLSFKNVSTIVRWNSIKMGVVIILFTIDRCPLFWSAIVHDWQVSSILVCYCSRLTGVLYFGLLLFTINRCLLFWSAIVHDWQVSSILVCYCSWLTGVLYFGLLFRRLFRLVLFKFYRLK